MGNHSNSRSLKSDFHDLIVPGLDMLISDPDVLIPDERTKKKAEVLYVPSFYVYRILDFYEEQSNRGESARELTAILREISEIMGQSCSDTFIFRNGMKLKFVDSPDRVVLRGMPRNLLDEGDSAKLQAIAVAKVLQEQYGKEDVAIMTGSDHLATLAAFNNIDVAKVNPDVYTGRVKVEIPEDYAGIWWRDHLIPKDVWDEMFPEVPLLINEYVEMDFGNYGQIDTNYRNIGRYNGEAIVPLRFKKINNPAFNRIWPKTPGQAMLFDALLAPVSETPIVIVSGTFGTGKTFCTVAAGLAQVMASEYREIFVCPRDGSLGREIGFLKGDKLDKILPQAAPILDSLEEIIRLMDIKFGNMQDDGGRDKRSKKHDQSTGMSMSIKKLVKQYREDYFEFEPIIYMGGRSIGGSFMIYDEFQDMERGQARALLSRIGNDSKIVVMGDPHQTTNPHLNRTSNGLSYSASKLAGDPLAAVISFNSDEIVRSVAARHIADRLSGRGFVNT